MQNNTKVFLFSKDSHFNLANLVTFSNIALGIIAIYFISNNNFFYGALFAWICGLFDILDGKIARKYSLSSQFGVQLDSFADFFSFVILPCLFLYFAIFKDVMSIDSLGSIATLALIAFSFIYYIISGVRRLISFNINTSEEEVEKYFLGMPTPLGAICLWGVYLLFVFIPSVSIYILLALMILIAFLLNSRIKIRHL